MGTKEAVRPSGSTWTIPGTIWPVVLSLIKKVPGLNVAGSIRSLNSTVNGAFTGTPVIPLEGLVRSTNGATVSTKTAVVNVLWNCCVIRLPATSRTPWTVTVCVFKASSCSSGVKVIDSPSLESFTLPGISVVSCKTLTTPFTTDSGESGSAKRTIITPLTGKFIAPSGGSIWETAGAVTSGLNGSVSRADSWRFVRPSLSGSSPASLGFVGSSPGSFGLMRLTRNRLS